MSISEKVSFVCHLITIVTGSISIILAILIQRNIDKTRRNDRD